MAEPKERSKPLPVSVTKPTPYTFDLGLLLANDPNPLQLRKEEDLEDDLSATARDGAQALVNQLLSTCPITSTPSGVLLSLPPISIALPREKVCRDAISLVSSLSNPMTNPNSQPLPAPKALTTWQKFAAKKGIKPKSTAARQKLVYDEATGEWVPKWGYKGANKAGEDDWIVEVDEKKEARRKEGSEARGDKRRERVERIRREERKMRANERREGKAKGGGD